MEENNVVSLPDEREEDTIVETFEMLAGYVDENGVTHNTFTLRDMMGKDEEAISRPDVKGNYSRVISLLISRLCTSIGTLTPKSVGGINNWEKIVKSLYVGDQDYILREIRKMSYGNEIELNHVCPNKECGIKLQTFIDIDELPVIEFKGDRIIKFDLPKGYKDKKGVIHKEGTIRLPNGLDREITVPLAKNNPAKAHTSLLTRLCKFNDGYPVDDDLMSSLTVRDREYLSNLLKDNIFGIETEVEVSCPDCGTNFKVSLNVVNFT